MWDEGVTFGLAEFTFSICNSCKDLLIRCVFFYMGLLGHLGRSLDLFRCRFRWEVPKKIHGSHGAPKMLRPISEKGWFFNLSETAHLNEWSLWSTAEFNWRIAFKQKKLLHVQETIIGLGSGYHRDLQCTKKAFIEACVLDAKQRKQEKQSNHESTWWCTSA